MYTLITKKKEGKAFTKEEIQYIINGYTKGEIPDYQIAALLMAICFQGLNEEETLNLTLAMRDSGDVLDLSAIPGIKVDKHSTGGVGDKTSLVLAPIIASLGVPVAKMSGRGLGHTGGTIDKMEAFPGLTTALAEDRFMDQVKKVGMAIAGQTANLAPADKKLYALRDTTATVNQESLIASSIMSKKLASGADAIVLDVKVGSGAFMKTIEDAESLAKTMVRLGNGAGRKTVAVLTNMDEPLGRAVGNTLEVMEAVDSLKGNGPEDFMEVVYTLGSQMLVLAGKASDEKAAKLLMEEQIKSGAALEKFADFIEAQGGNREDAKDPKRLLDAKYIVELESPKTGLISHIEAETIGRGSMTLGGGREKKEDTIDLSVGLILNKKVGDSVKAGESLATVYANDPEKLKKAKELLLTAYEFSSEAEPNPMVYKIIK